MSKRKKTRIKKFNRNQKVGLPPGSIRYVGKDQTEEVEISLITYNLDVFNVSEKHSISDIATGLDSNSVNWINLDGIHNPDVIMEFNTAFDLDPLLLEDVTNTNQRPKTDDYENCLFLTLKTAQFNPEDVQLNLNQISLVLSKNYVISFQEKAGDIFSSIRERITLPKGQIRRKKNDYLFYALIDYVVDHYFIVTEKIGDQIEELEDEVFNDPNQRSLEKIQQIKNVLMAMRRTVYPLRESINKLIRDDDTFIQTRNNKYFRDVYDHTVQIIEILETYKDMVNGLKDSYLSALSLKMNQVMQVLTIIATIFIPLTFIAGIYGMNFEHIPELKWPNGYWYFWTVCIVIVIGLIFYFRRKKWL